MKFMSALDGINAPMKKLNRRVNKAMGANKDLLKQKKKKIEDFKEVN